MHIHVLGVCGTFMGSLALIAREAGHTVTGSDQGIYPPMSDLLAAQGVGIMEGYRPEHLEPAPDCVVVGNALSRGNPAVEHMLDRGIDYRSGPQWLAENVLKDKWVIAVSGTHGKTTTTSLVAWILEYAGLRPGFLIGGVPSNFGISARLGESDFFVIEADEYDSAFFDKRSKFLHFRPRTLIVNNIEYDHADIFPDLKSIQRQFHYLVRTVPGSGLIIANGDETSVAETLAMGCWTPVQRFGREADNDWRVAAIDADSHGFSLEAAGGEVWQASLALPGLHNAHNALAAVLAARHVGVPVDTAIEALAEFKGVKRRLELRGEVDGIRVYDDFAHHPTAIEATVAAMRRDMTSGRILAVVEPRSNTMKLGVHRQALASALGDADLSFLLQPDNIGWNVSDAVAPLGARAQVENEVDVLVERIVRQARHGDRILVMSNGAFGGIHRKLLAALRTATGKESAP